ncbi:DUF6011 domain-containing protein [Nocardia testacea]|uniref:DUF6011 domain-containing protein n=1 Tax=Nocardia testacea TaxID=248551 RepID=A0ABW7W4Q6_9NOCA
MAEVAEDRPTVKLVAHCRRCRGWLLSPRSVAEGIGPTCAAREQGERAAPRRLRRNWSCSISRHNSDPPRAGPRRRSRRRVPGRRVRRPSGLSGRCPWISRPAHARPGRSPRRGRSSPA